MTKIFDYEKREILAKNSHKTVSKLICAYLRTKLNLNPVQSSPAQPIFITTLIVEYFIFIKISSCNNNNNNTVTIIKLVYAFYSYVNYHSSYFLCDGDGGGVKSNSIHTHYDGREFTVHLDKFS